MAKSFLQRVHPARRRTKVISWPFAAEPGEPSPRLQLRVLTGLQFEQANIEAREYFKAKKELKDKVSEADAAFTHRERNAIVWMAVHEVTGDGDPLQTKPLTATSEEMHENFPQEFINALYYEWVAFQNSVATRPQSKDEFEGIVQELKKNFQPALLAVWPSTWLIELISILVAPSSSSSTPSELG